MNKPATTPAFKRTTTRAKRKGAPDGPLTTYITLPCGYCKGRGFIWAQSYTRAER